MQSVVRQKFEVRGAVLIAEGVTLPLGHYLGYRVTPEDGSTSKYMLEVPKGIWQEILPSLSGVGRDVMIDVSAEVEAQGVFVGNP